jgi:hypothetical protein
MSTIRRNKISNTPAESSFPPFFTFLRIRSPVARPQASRSRSRFCPAVIHGHLEMHGHPELAVRQFLQPNDLGHIFAIHRIVGRTERKSDENPHASVVRFPPRGEVDALFGGIHADRQVFEVLVPGIRRSNANRPGDFRPAAEPFIWIHFLGGFWQGVLGTGFAATTIRVNG